MNPFDLPGPEFLRFFGVFAVVVTAIAIMLARLLRWRLARIAEQDAQCDAPDLQTYEIACLAGGLGLAVRAAISGMIHRGALVLVPRKGLRTKDDSGRGLSCDLERSIHVSLRTKPWQSVEKLCQEPRIAAQGEEMRSHLQRLGLKPPEREIAKVSWIPLLAVLGVTALGVTRSAIGATHGRSVAFLIAFSIVFLVFALPFVWPLSGNPASFTARTRTGDGLLDAVRRRNRALEHISTRKPEAIASGDLALAVGLFGTGVLSGESFANVRSAVRHTADPVVGLLCGDGVGGCGGGGCGGCGGG